VYFGLHVILNAEIRLLRAETAHWLEWQDWAEPILQRPYEIKAGQLHIPDVPGIGLEWDEKAVSAHLADD
jgi:mandelate racemase